MTDRAKSKTVLFMLCALAAAAALEAASLRGIRRQILRKDYAQAERDLEDEMRRFTGRDLNRAKLMLAGLKTDVKEAGPLLRDVAAGGGPEESLRARVELAKIHYSEGRYAEAASILEDIPTDADRDERLEAIYLRGLSRKQTGDRSAARKDFESIDRGDYLYWSYMSLAEIDMQEGRFDQAAERFETIAGSHSNPIAGFKLGECYEIMGDLGAALDAYRTLATTFPESPEAPKAREKIQRIEQRAQRGGARMNTGGGEKGERPAERAKPAQEEDRVMYTLQFGAFSEKDNAESFIAELGDLIDGLRIETVESGGKVWHRVRAGRFRSREEAEEEALRIMEKTGYSSKVLPM